MSNTISILGCGWLGLPLAQLWHQLGYTIKGSTTAVAKLSKLKAANIDPYQLTVSEKGSYPNDFFQSDILVITLPFKRSLTDPSTYTKYCQSLIPYIEKSPVQWVLFASSTTVYPNQNNMVFESDKWQPETERAAQLLITERLFFEHPTIPSTIIRFGGLYGPNRLPGRLFKQRPPQPGGKNPVNMIHLDDCLGIMTAILQQHQQQEIFNAVHPHHSTKQQFYQIPFQSTLTDHKRVSAQRVVETLGYTFKK